ncbi:MAG: V-type ATPase 116kDa subunit family protein, partial [Acutalibacteraceae bacterium]|nr:V-type ATPase 116kDa subunit family protein [Acutalibacteraceae bacterium]
MERINIYALKKNRKKILEELQRKGVIQIEDVSIEETGFTKEQTAQKQTVFLKNSSLADNSVNILNKYAPEKSSMLSMFDGRKQITVENYYMYVEDANEIMRVAYDIINAEKSIADSKSDIAKCNSQIESLEPWQTFDINMNFKGTNSTTAFIGVIPQFVTYEELITRLNEISNKSVGIDLEIVSHTTNQTCIFLICNNIYADNVNNLLKQYGFSRPPVIPKDTPIETINELKKEIEKLENNIESQTKLIKSYIGIRHALMFISDYYIMRADKYAVIEKLGMTRSTFFLTGFVPKESSNELGKELSKKFDAEVEIYKPSKDEEIPIMLKNNSFVAPVESVLETYSMPKKDEVDPTAVMAIFYYIFFGMMFSDAGYGLIMTGACAFVLNKFRNMEENLKKSVKMFMYCGISTAFWGFMYGSFFGDAVTIIGKTFFNVDISLPAIWLNPVEGSNSMTVLMFCFLFGIVHLFVGLGMKAYMCIKSHHYLDAVYDIL